MRGETVILYNQTKTGVDEFGKDVYTETAETVNDVLIGTPTSSEVVDAFNLYGKVARYALGIPKGDTHTWEDRKVSFYGKEFHTIGFLIEADEKKIPLRWKGYIMVERYE